MRLSFPPKISILPDRLMSTSVCWELTCDGLVSRPREVKDFHPLNTTEIEDKRGLDSMGNLACEGFSFSSRGASIHLKFAKLNRRASIHL